MRYTKPIKIEKMDEQTEDWSDFIPLLHARINKNRGGESYSAGAIQSTRELTFDVRFFPKLKEIAKNTQLFRIIYDDVQFNIEDYDDFEEKHMSIRLLGVSY